MKRELVDLAKHRLKRSKEAKRDALLLFKKGSYASAINKNLLKQNLVYSLFR